MAGSKGAEWQMNGDGFPPALRAYLGALEAATRSSIPEVVSLIAFGSAVVGGYEEGLSDVDLIIVVSDETDAEGLERVRATVAGVEAEHGLGPSLRRSATEQLLDRLTANVRSFFVCTRTDLLSGDAARILGLPRAQASFVDGVVLPSIFNAAATVSGEDLVHGVPLRPVTRGDILRAWFALTGQALLCVLAYPFTRDATKFAMGVVKRSVHNCYCCYHGAPAQLSTEAAFFARRRPSLEPPLRRLLALRRDYLPSPRFVAGAAWILAQLHLVTALDNQFPRVLGRPPSRCPGRSDVLC